MKRIPSPQDQGWGNEVIKILKRLGSLKAEYPAELLAARRAAFLLQVEQQETSTAEGGLLSNGHFLHYLENLKTIRAEYPPELLAARRAAFVGQIGGYQLGEGVEDLGSEDQEIIRLFRSLKSVEAEYPPNLMAARRAAFKRQLAFHDKVSVLDALRTSIRSLFSYKVKSLSMPAMNMMRTSLVVITLMLAAFIGSLLQVPAQSSVQGGISRPGPILVATVTDQVAKIVCAPGYLPPLCQVKATDESADLTFQGNGLARPAVAKDALPDSKGAHKAAYVNDGLYGPGTSWVSNSAYSWIKIDLGKATTINTVAFGKDRLGNSKGGDPGQFVIAVALSDNVYADGNSSNDYIEYTQVYDSKQAGFNGIISGSQTVQARFDPVMARYIKITFANPRTAVDEVEAFMIREPELADTPTRRPKENPPPGIFPTSIPTSPSLPTVIPSPVPTNTPVPADTATPIPTNTSAPTDTPVPPPPPTDTPVPPPPPTDTPVPPPPPTDTPVPPPPPTDTPIPPPPDTPVPPPVSVTQPADTPIPAAAAPVNNPTDTPIPVQP